MAKNGNLTPGLTELERAARITPITTLTDTEAMIDLDKMRRYRLSRLRDELKACEIGACVLSGPHSIRYATGVRNCALFQAHILAGYLFVPAEGPVVYFDSEAGRLTAAGLGTVDEIRDDIIPLSHMFAGRRLDEWAGKWAAQMTDLVDRHCSGNRRLAVEIASSEARQGLVELDIEVMEVAEPLGAARAIKSPEEVLCMNHAIAVAEDGMCRMRDALRPGLTETELWTLLWAANVEAGGDWIEGRLASAGDRSNPWMQEASSRIIRAGDLFVFDCDMVGPFGYAADISRTYHCGPGKPSAYQRELYQRAYEEVRHNLELMKPGAGFRELSEKSFRQPKEFRIQRYPVVAHGIGMSDEWPAIFYPEDAQFIFDGELEPGMAFCVESYVGEVDGPEGVKLEEQILITETGHAILSKFPFEESLLS